MPLFFFLSLFILVRTLVPCFQDVHYHLFTSLLSLCLTTFSLLCVRQTLSFFRYFYLLTGKRQLSPSPVSWPPHPLQVLVPAPAFALSWRGCGDSSSRLLPRFPAKSSLSPFPGAFLMGEVF